MDIKEALDIALRQWKGYIEDYSWDDVENLPCEESKLYRECARAAKTAESQPETPTNSAMDAILALKELVAAVDSASRLAIGAAMANALRVLKQHKVVRKS
jgi:hypothetical protein